MADRTLAVGEVDLAATLASLAFLPGDPCVRLRPDGFARATWTPEGPGIIEVSWGAGAGEPAPSEARPVEARSAQVTALGDGAAWLLARADRLLGVADDVRGFEPTTQPIRDVWRRRRGDRIPASGTLWHDLAWWIVQQRVTREDAAEQWRRFVQGLGTPAPGQLDLRLPPAPAVVARLPYHRFHAFGIERRRADHLVEAARVALRLGARVDEGAAALLAHLRAVRGVGPWTASCVQASTWGDPDTVIVGDDGIPSLLTWVLAGEARGDDARMLELLEPYRGHRYRVLRLAMASGIRPPRRAPRGRRTDIRRW